MIQVGSKVLLLHVVYGEPTYEAEVVELDPAGSDICIVSPVGWPDRLFVRPRDYVELPLGATTQQIKALKDLLGGKSE